MCVNREPLEHRAILDLTDEMARRLATYFCTSIFLSLVGSSVALEDARNKMFD